MSNKITCAICKHQFVNGETIKPNFTKKQATYDKSFLCENCYNKEKIKREENL